MFLNINKPAGLTSHDVVDKVREITGEKRVGHGGTLDPFATGVLVIAVGRESTRQLGEVLKNTDKEYLATLELGKTSSTGDPEGEIKDVSENPPNVSKEDTLKALKKFTGEIKQTPPPYSAIKIGGVPAHRLTRQGKEVSIPPRTIMIKKISLLEFNPPFLTIKVACSSGTYIRSLAQDIGQELGTGAYLKTLTRTKVGKFKIEESQTLEKVKGNLKSPNSPSQLDQ